MNQVSKIQGGKVMLLILEVFKEAKKKNIHPYKMWFPLDQSMKLINQEGIHVDLKILLLFMIKILRVNIR